MCLVSRNKLSLRLLGQMDAQNLPLLVPQDGQGPVRCGAAAHDARGPAGAKGIGELPLDGTAPAIVNAIENATGVCIRRVPVTPEDLLIALEESRERAIA